MLKSSFHGAKLNRYLCDINPYTELTLNYAPYKGGFLI